MVSSLCKKYHFFKNFNINRGSTLSLLDALYMLWFSREYLLLTQLLIIYLPEHINFKSLAINIKTMCMHIVSKKLKESIDNKA